MRAFALAPDTIPLDSDVISQWNLDEVVVKAKNVRHHADKDVWIITDVMRKGAFTTNMMLARIPGIRYNNMDEELTYMGKNNVLVLMDGKEKEIGYVGNLANLRFRKVEIYPNPVGRYQNYDVVINMISYDNYEGIEGLVEEKTTILPSTPFEDYVNQCSPKGTLTYTRGSWNVATHYDFAHNNTQRSHDMTRDEPNDTHIVALKPQWPTYEDINNSHKAWIDADFDINKRHAVSVKYSFNSFRKNGNTDYLMEKTVDAGIPSTYHEAAWNHSTNAEHIVSMFYRGQFGDYWKMYADATADFYSNNNSYHYFEGERQVTSALTDNSQHSVRSTLDATYQRNKNTMNFGSVFVKMKNEYLTSGESSEAKENRIRFYTTYTYALTQHITSALGGTLEYIHNNANSDNQTLWSLNARTSINFTDDCILRLNYRGNVSYPNQWQMNPTGMFQDSTLYICGNPDLRSNVMHNVNLNLYLNGLTLNANFNFCNNAIYKTYRQTGRFITMQDQNTKIRQFDLNCGKTFTLNLDDAHLLMLGLNLSYAYNYIDAAGIVNHHHDYNGEVYAWYMSETFPNDIQLKYRRVSRMYIQPQGYDMGGEDGYILSVSHKMLGGRLYASVDWLLPIEWGVRRRLEYVMNTPYYSKTASQDWFTRNQNKISIHLMYRFASGKIVKKKNNVQSVEEKGSWAIQ